MPSRHNHRRRGVKKRTVEQRVNAKRATAHKHIPDRGEVDPHDGSTWDGIGKMKLKFRDLDNDNLDTDSVDGRVVAASSIEDGHINGRLSKATIPSDTAFQADIVKKANDLGWGDGSKYIPDGALKNNYASSDGLSAVKQSVSGLGNKIQKLSQRIKKLEQGKKKN